MARSRRVSSRSAGRDLLDLARGVAERAYAPYSGFSVGVALEDASKQRFLGANVENASYPLGICAERVALLAWREASGGPITRGVIFSLQPAPTPPCGLCREALLRWAPKAEIWLATRRGLRSSFRPTEWLPATTNARRRRS